MLFLETGEWEKLIEEIRQCRKCPLHKTRKNPVPGEGSIETKVMFVGEAPGAREDEEGRPFVGAAGKLLTELLESIGVKREQVYITNVIKCRPPGNRDPTEEEIAACLPYLIRQIKLLQPRVIIALGRHAAKTLFKLAGLTWKNMTAMHGRVHEGVIEGIKVKIVATYHPAAALYYPKLRPVLENDFRDVIKHLITSSKETTGKKQRSLLDYI
ncbi:uracil-DNA glycosylase [Desulfurococcaceae archaeon MEX13E-LK6-19]|nr:uracil-DNA glycosylase [Desulfurococcaceae archaeon MEX13E-LK6-19]